MADVDHYIKAPNASRWFVQRVYLVLNGTEIKYGAGQDGLCEPAAAFAALKPGFHV
jgi:hypothetical protein